MERVAHTARKLKSFFEDEKLYGAYQIDKREIYFNSDNAILFNDILDSLDIPNNERGVPTAVIGDKVLVSDKTIINNFKSTPMNFCKILTKRKKSNPTLRVMNKNQI